MFMGPYDEGGDWNDKGITGISRFIAKIWKFCQLPDSCEILDEDLKVIHKTIKSVKNDLSLMKFNTAISRLMECMNYFSKHEFINNSLKKIVIKIIAPLVPHISEELWEINGGTRSVFEEKFPEYDKNLIVENIVSIAIQVNGKLRGTIEVDKSIEKEDLIIIAKAQDNVALYLKGKQLIKEIVVPERLINFVVK